MLTSESDRKTDEAVLGRASRLPTNAPSVPGTLKARGLSRMTPTDQKGHISVILRSALCSLASEEHLKRVVEVKKRAHGPWFRIIA